MSEVDAAIDKQMELDRLLRRTLENLQKTGAAKRTLRFLETRLDVLEKNWRKFENGHESLLSDWKSVSLTDYAKNRVYESCENEYAAIKTTILEMIDEKRDLQGNDSLNEKPNSVAVSRTRQLPRINLPKFSGICTQWINFRDLFTSMIGNDTDLSNAERIHYLKMSLSGEPAQLISSVKATADGYQRAWTILKSRYENTRLLIDGHLTALLSHKTVKPDSVTDLKQLYADVTESLGALTDLGCTTEEWDPIIVHIVSRKFDAETVKDWERTLGKQIQSPSFAQLEEFMLTRIHMLEAYEQFSARKSPNIGTSVGKPNASRTCHTSTKVATCPLCGEGHYLAHCSQYREKTPAERREIIITKRLCYNCLGSHSVKACNSQRRCRECNLPHHSSIHGARRCSETSSGTSSANNKSTKSHSATEPKQTTDISPSTSERREHSTTTCQAVNTRIETDSPVFLVTALVTVTARSGEQVVARALLDNGSEASFISESLAQKLQLSRRATALPIIGVGGKSIGVARGIALLKITSRNQPAYSFELETLVLPRVTAYQPPRSNFRPSFDHMVGLDLADPTYYHATRIDLLFGMQVYTSILLPELRRNSEHEPIAQKTRLGWIVNGPFASSAPRTSDTFAVNQYSIDHELHDLLKSFWLQEELTPTTISALTPDELESEKHFASTHSRDSSGRFCVRLPRTFSPKTFGNTRDIALRMLLRTEKQVDATPALREEYIKFMREYENQQHMRKTEVPITHLDREFLLPHHGVLRPHSTTTKLRVVFNGSQKTSAGISLNDTLLIGAKLQNDIADVLLRWRRHIFVFAADIQKMYRQINVHQNDWHLQRILWRESSTQPIDTYDLTTVTYGLACAPFLKIRCLLQLATEGAENYPVAAEIIRNDTYIDDIISGANSINEAQEKMRQLRTLLSAGGFPLRKWIANDDNVLSEVSADERDPSTTRSFTGTQLPRMLGISWDHESDRFVFAISRVPIEPLTKRRMLSHIAQTYDPLGWLSPITVTAKIFLQDIWARKLSWDEAVPDDLKNKWKAFNKMLNCSDPISLPRWIGLHNDICTVEIHGFSDASQAAMAACVYLRTTTDDRTRVELIAAKTKIAPLKKLTIPRLELCAALLLVRLTTRIKSTLQLEKISTIMWTDSTVALAWIQQHPSRWKEFVRNRVTEIQDLPRSRWRHVAGSDNPADLASRGTSINQLRQNSLWWNGPDWLRENSTFWPEPSRKIDTKLALSEQVTTCHVASHETQRSLWEIVNRFSMLSRLLRITAWILRFIARCKRDRAATTEHLDPLEINAALKFWIRQQQHVSFEPEIEILREGESVKKSNALFRLTPFLDEDGLVRVGGRLRFTHLHQDEKHPYILPRDSTLTNLIMKHHHLRTLHGGVQLTMASIREQCWILGGRKPIRSFINKCITCARQRAKAASQQIGQLPTSRVTAERAFHHTGIDYAGPFHLKTIRGRGAKTYKGYLVLFVCLSTSALHLEIATDYTTEGFVASMRRFIGRRGLCRTMRSDCGMNLVGADRDLKRMFQAAALDWRQVANLLSNDGITWIFNPPAAPHFGGKWEASVKSVKYHLRRVLGETRLTYEEFNTLIIQIEATLNSRPLGSLSDDPEDRAALTPGHFLIGTALNAIPEPSLTEVKPARLSRWQHLQYMMQHFWHRWSAEYLHQLHLGNKWHQPQPEPRLGALVLLKDERLPVGKCALARIIALHPGKDHRTRVVTIKTQFNTLTRPITKICYLPMDPELTSQRQMSNHSLSTPELTRAGGNGTDSHQNPESAVAMTEPPGI